MDAHGIRKTYQYHLTPEQKQAMAFVLRRCRELYNAALQECKDRKDRKDRKEAWLKCGVSVSVAHQCAQLPAINAVRPEYCDRHSQVLQELLTPLERAFPAFFRRVKNGATPGYPRFQGSSRYNRSLQPFATTVSPTSSGAPLETMAVDHGGRPWR